MLTTAMHAFFKYNNNNNLHDNYFFLLVLMSMSGLDSKWP